MSTNPKHTDNWERTGRDMQSVVINYVGLDQQQVILPAANNPNGAIVYGYIHSINPGGTNPRLLFHNGTTSRSHYSYGINGHTHFHFDPTGMVTYEAGVDINVINGTASGTNGSVLILFAVL